MTKEEIEERERFQEQIKRDAEKLVEQDLKRRPPNGK